MLLLQRRWVAGHLLALFMAALFVALGFWQLARNQEKHDVSAKAKAAYAAPAPPISTISADAADGTRAEARGTFDGAHEAVLRNQVHDGTVGIAILTPLRLPDGTAVLVNRGWVRASAGNGVTTDPPPTGTAVVYGLVHQSSPLSADDSVDHLGDGALAVPRVDLEAIGRPLPYKLRPLWIEAQAITPKPAGNAPTLPQPPPPDPVNHMQYALEWFAFALIPTIGWPIALRRLTRQRTAAMNVSTESTDSTTPVPNRNGRVGSRPRTP